MSESIKLESQISLRRSRAISWAEILSPAAGVRIAILAVLLVAAYWGEIRYLTSVWTNQADWTHGWLIPVIGLYIIHLNRERLSRIPVRPSLWGVPVMLAAAAIYIQFIRVPIGYPRSASLLLMLAGTVLLMGGWRLALALWFPITLLLFAIPLPEMHYFYATLPLRRIVTLLSTGMLNLLPGVDAKPEGTVILYIRNGIQGRLNVEEACSGMRLLMAFLAMGAIMAYLMREKPVWHRVVLLLLCVPIAIFCNFVRVTVTSVLHVYGYTQLAQGGSHAALGLAMMVVALGLFWVTNWVLSSLVTEEEEPQQTAGSSA